LIAQAEMAKAQAGLQKDKADFAIAQANVQQEIEKLKLDLASKAADLQLKREEMHLVDERERDKAEADVAVKIAIANAQFGKDITIEQIRADVAEQKMASDAATARETASMQAETAKATKSNGEAKPKEPKSGPKTIKIVHDGKPGKMTEFQTDG
jgi:hypothetical protein